MTTALMALLIISDFPMGSKYKDYDGMIISYIRLRKRSQGPNLVFFM